MSAAARSCRALFGALALGVATAAGAGPVQYAPGLITTAAIHDGIDYEFISVVQAVTPENTRVVARWVRPDPSAPGGKVETTAQTVTRAEDLESARRLILVHAMGDPETFPGATTSGFSRALYSELKGKGEAAVVLGAARTQTDGPLASLLAGRKYYRGTLKRVEPGTVAFPMLLDGKRVSLPALHVKGRVAVGTDAGDAEFWILDDAGRPTTLKWTVLGATAQVVRIDNPRQEVHGDAHPKALQLDKGLEGGACRVELHGVYFNTGSATLLPESKPALEGVAAVLEGKPEWSVSVEGHTDNIGDAAANLALSKRRAEAVRSALIGQYRVAAARVQAAGYGATRPVESNDTLEGRAHNRRVELSRKCP